MWKNYYKEVRTKEWVLHWEDSKISMRKFSNVGIVRLDSKSWRERKTKGKWTKVFNNNTNDKKTIFNLNILAPCFENSYSTT